MSSVASVSGLLCLVLVLTAFWGLAAAWAAMVIAPVLLSRPAGHVRDENRRASLIGMAIALAVPVTGFLIWRLHLAVQGIGPDMAPRAVADWAWSAPVTVMRALLVDRLANNPVLGLGQFGADAMSGRLAPVLAAVAAIGVHVAMLPRWRIDCIYPHVEPGYHALMVLFDTVPATATVTVVNADDGEIFHGVALLARTVAKRDWRGRRAVVVADANGAPPTDFTIDLRQANIDRYRRGPVPLDASLHRGPLTGPLIAATSQAPTCRALRVGPR